MAWENYARLPPPPTPHPLQAIHFLTARVENNDKNNNGEIMKTTSERWKKLSHTE